MIKRNLALAIIIIATCGISTAQDLKNPKSLGMKFVTEFDHPISGHFREYKKGRLTAYQHVKETDNHQKGEVGYHKGNKIIRCYPDGSIAGAKDKFFKLKHSRTIRLNGMVFKKSEKVNPHKGTACKFLYDRVK